ncbi:MAG: hypothetical protein EOL97_05225 [Spirochaetia bacterium]|nr:hypothetical protein [Spirochaetia bacterium]
MTSRQFYHIYKILEDYSKLFISFDYTPEFIIHKNYYLSYNDINNILKENQLLINALYNKNETEINQILKKEDIIIDEFNDAQIENESKKTFPLLKKTPLPIQARYVLKAWNMIRLFENQEKRKSMINTFNKKAFNNSFFPQITKMALAFDLPIFSKYALESQNCAKSNEQLILFYSLITYYFRINKNQELQEKAILLEKAYKENNLNLKEERNIIKEYLKNKAILNKEKS